MRYAGAGFVFMLLLVGCGGGGNHESLTRESLGVMDEMSTILENSKTADEAKPKLEKVAAKFKDLKKRFDALPKLSDADKENMEKKLKPDMEKSVKKFFVAMTQFAQRDPLGMQKLQDVLKDIEMGPK